jgi:hypothetical protein
LNDDTKNLAHGAKFARVKNSDVADIREAVRYTRVEFAKFDAEEIDEDDNFYSKRCSEKEQPSIGIVTQTSKVSHLGTGTAT